MYSTVSAGCKADNTRGGFWEYFSQLTHEKEGWDSQQNTVPEINNLKSSFQNGIDYVSNILGPMKNGFQQRLYQDSDGLRKLIHRELQELRQKIYPYMDEAHQKVSKHLDNLQSRLIPYTNELKDQVGWGAQELHLKLKPHQEDLNNWGLNRLTENLQDRIILHTGRVKEAFYPLAERLLSEIHHAAEELHLNILPHTYSTQEKLSQQVQELSQRLNKNARELHEKIHKNLDDLKEQLVSYPQGLKEKFPNGGTVEPVGPFVDEMAAQVQREVEEFKRNTQMQIEDFTRTINREAEEMQKRLSPASWDLEDTVGSVEDVQKKLDSLWKDIAQSLD
ncbi:hypothetical protein GDO86_012781 [Hymenochirus boettgeri]|uniref:Apolipoprotein A-V n=1 Tax=Hymenochirus boettgeri TaxID=247094 RepID=A0A8T2IVR8_9PIPI|nr:hypothetical protein GDO86_012781 [Hymenochirus boettgeri]